MFTSQVFVTVLAASLGYKYIPMRGGEEGKGKLSNNRQWN